MRLNSNKAKACHYKVNVSQRNTSPKEKKKRFNSLSFSTEQNHFRNHEGPRSPKESAGGRSQVSFGPTGTQQAALSSQDGDKKVKKQPSAGFVEGSSSQGYSADPVNFLPERTQRGKADEDGYVALRKDNSSSGRKNLLVFEADK